MTFWRHHYVIKTTYLAFRRSSRSRFLSSRASSRCLISSSVNGSQYIEGVVFVFLNKSSKRIAPLKTQWTSRTFSAKNLRFISFVIFWFCRGFCFFFWSIFFKLSFTIKSEFSWRSAADHYLETGPWGAVNYLLIPPRTGDRDALRFFSRRIVSRFWLAAGATGRTEPDFTFSRCS